MHQDKNGWNSLVWSSNNNYIEIVLYLIDCGILTFYDINSKYYQIDQLNIDSLTNIVNRKQLFKSPLQKAAINGATEICSILI